MNYGFIGGIVDGNAGAGVDSSVAEIDEWS
jgi:hypothetical protein